MSHIRVRPARLQDIPSIVRLLDEQVQATAKEDMMIPGIVEPDVYIEFVHAVSNHALFIAVTKTAGNLGLAGFLQFVPVTYPWNGAYRYATDKLFITDPKFKAFGTSKALIETVRDFIRSKGGMLLLQPPMPYEPSEKYDAASLAGGKSYGGYVHFPPPVDPQVMADEVKQALQGAETVQ